LEEVERVGKPEQFEKGSVAVADEDEPFIGNRGGPNPFNVVSGSGIRDRESLK